MPHDLASYAARLAAEMRFYRHDEEVHELPEIFHYWSNRYIKPKLEAFGFDSPDAMFRKYVREQCGAGPGPRRFLSIGAGNCDLEIGIALDLRASGFDGFVIDCVDLNAEMLERGRVAAREAGVENGLNFIEADLNLWTPEHEHNAVLANQALHHVVELESLFTRIRGALASGGKLIVSDIAGRNGHQRWPEALEIVHEFWRKLPPSYRFNRKLERYEEMYENWDCSGHGFEAIRSQDLLPLMIANFHFDLFIAFANVIEPFVDRAFGYNFDAAAAWDRGFIDAVHARDEAEFLCGRLKPTHILAVLGTDSAVPALCQSPLTAQFCVRSEAPAVSNVKATDQPYDWSVWPHSAQSELEIACRRLKEVEDRVTARERVLSEMASDLGARTQWARDIEARLEDRTRWALLLEQEVRDRTESEARLREDLEKTNAELDKRTDWALGLKRELEQLVAEFDKRTKWALDLQKELEQSNIELEQRTAWAQDLDRRVAAASAQAQALAATLDRLNWARALDRRFHALLDVLYRAVRRMKRTKEPKN